MRFVNDDIKFVFKMWMSVWFYFVLMVVFVRICLVCLFVSVFWVGWDKYVS